MNKKDLSQLYYLNREIEEQQKRIAELEDIATSCTGSITGMPHGNGISDKIARCTAELIDLQGLLDLNIKKCFYELNRLNRFINTIEDSQMRLILTLRYINGLSWQQIAFSIGETDEQYPRRKHNSFLKTYKWNEENVKDDENDEHNVLK